MQICISGTEHQCFPLHPWAYFESPPILHLNLKQTRKHVRMHAFQKQVKRRKYFLLHRNKTISTIKSAPSTHYRLRNNPAVAKDLFSLPGHSWYYETHKDIPGCSCPKDTYSWLWNDSKPILSLSWRGTCLLYHMVQRRPGELKSTEKNRMSGGKQGIRGLMVKIPTLARSREWVSLARRSRDAASWTKKGWTMIQKTPPTAPGTRVLTGLTLPPRGYLVIAAEHSTGKKNGPQTSATSNLQLLHHGALWGCPSHHTISCVCKKVAC